MHNFAWDTSWNHWEYQGDGRFNEGHRLERWQAEENGSGLFAMADYAMNLWVLLSQH
jgi:hypothetical protein